MREILTYLIFGLQAASIYAVAASGLVVTYTTSGMFNFAHGAIGMLAAFSYWELHVNRDVPTPIALALVLFVVGPALGLLIERVIMRGLAGASTITRIVVSISLLFTFIQVGAVIWPQEKNYRIPRFFDGNFVRLGDVNVAWHSLIVFGLAIGVAVGLRLLLYRSRLGVAMRAVVDDRDLTFLNGINPGRTSMAAWALGCSLAALSGVLIGPLLQLSVVGLTLLVINAYAAAMVGRLRSLPLTFLGALILGLGESALGYAQFKSTSEGTIDAIAKIKPSLPIIMLFVVLVVLPQDKAAFTGPRMRNVVPMPSLRSAVVAWGALVAGAAALSYVLSDAHLTEVGKGMALAIVMLSLVPLIGYAGQISLAQLAFAGVGAFVAWKVAPDGGVLGLVAAVVAAGAVGALVALPTLRLKDLYLALVTMAFAILFERNFLGEQRGFRTGTGVAILERVPGFEGDHANFILLAIVFGAVGVLISLLRMGHPGRRLQAMKDSPAACATLGLDLTTTKLGIFAFSAAIAGLGGALLMGWKSNLGVSQSDFSLLEGAYAGLPVVLMAVIGGITSVSGALVGGLLLAGMPLLGSGIPALGNLMKVAPGVAGISLGRNPDGATGQVVARLEERKAGAEPPVHPVAGSGEVSAISPSPVPPDRPPVPEQAAAGERYSPDQIKALESALGFEAGEEVCRART